MCLEIFLQNIRKMTNCNLAMFAKTQFNGNKDSKKKIFRIIDIVERYSKNIKFKLLLIKRHELNDYYNLITL